MSARTPQSYKLQEQTKRSVQLEIKDATYNQGTHKAFICKVDLESIWRNSTKIRTIFGSSPAWTDNELDNIQNNFVKIISILVSINSAQVNQFRELFYAFRGGGRDRTDKDLPFTEDETHFLGADQELFLEKQYAFLPVTIEQSDESQTQEVEQQYRLPFLEEGLALGCGGFGTVFKVKVAPRYLRTKVDDETHFNEEVSCQCSFYWEEINDTWQARPLACKRFQTDHSGEDFKREVKNLGLLKESLATRKHIMLHITTIVHGGDFNILLPIAKHGNLEVFLNRGLDKNDGSAKAQTLYNFETVFPRFEDPLRHKSILSEMYALADALLWLHRDLNIPTDPDLCCAHMDLKPNNILIDSGGPSRIFGKWMITDFGISVFRRVPLTEEDDEKEDVTNVGVETVGDLGARLEPRTATIKTKQLHEGTYQAPEAYRLGVKRVGRKSDIWSFGCVLSEVLAFALGDEELLKEFRNLRVEGFKNDYFYRERKVTIDEEDNRFLGTSNPGSAYVYEPKFDIDCWLSNLPRRYPKHSHWLKSCVDLIKSTLEIDPKIRVDAALLTKNLKKVLTLLDKEFRSPPSLGQISPVSPPPAVPQHTNGLGIQGLQNSPNPPRPRIPTLMAYPPSSVFVSESLASTSFPSVVGPPDLTTVIARTDRNHRRLSLREDPDQSGVSTTQVGYTTPPPSRPRLAELQSSNPSPDRQSSESGTAYHRNQPQSPISSRSSITTQTSSGSRSVKCNLSGGKVTSHSLSPDGVYAAFLYASHVCICRVDTGEQLKTVSLTSDDKWLTIRISGFYLAVSGFTKAKKKTVCLCPQFRLLRYIFSSNQN
jgi:serine/threonine protein kinase